MSPRKRIAAQLYRAPSDATGTPAAISELRPEVSKAILSRDFAASSKSVRWWKRSPHVYAVTESSGNTISCAPFAAASFASRIIDCAFESQSATVTEGLAQAARKKPYFMLLLYTKKMFYTTMR